MFEEIKVIHVECQTCEKFMPVIQLDTCTETNEVITTMAVCPLGKWTNGD